MAGIVQLLISDTIMSFMWVRSSVPVQLLIFDTIMSFMWVWSGVLIKLFVHNVLGFNHDGFPAEVFRSSLSILDMVFFAYIAKLTNGGAYNPLTVLSSAIWPISGNFVTFFFTIGLRILFQVMGAITGVNCILATFPEKGFPEIGRGPRLTVSPSEGALTEGLLTFTIVLISHGLSTKIPGNFFRKTWIASVSRVALRTLGSDLTGGCMNPAFVMGWAYARGDHITMEHLLVYWVAPIVATLLATWTFTYLERTSKQDKEKKTN